MAFVLNAHATLDVDPHRYRVLVPSEIEGFLRAVAVEYVRIRSESLVALREVSLDGVDVVGVGDLKKRLQAAVVPPLGDGKFEIIRSDFGEVIAYMILEGEGARFGYKGVRDRETVPLPGRGIDGVAVEPTDPVTLILAEVKVSDEQRTPPRVVDVTNDCLRRQHRAHLKDKKGTLDKLWNLSRFARDPDTRDLFLRALLLYEAGRPVRLVSYCVLVRSLPRYKERDFGTFRSKASDYNPSNIRFQVVCTPADVDATVARWYQIVMEQAGKP